MYSFVSDCLPVLTEIVNDLYNRFGYLLEQLDLVWLDPATFANAIHTKGAPLANCWGFIDETARRICRPIKSQQVMYSAHKTIHCLKFQVRLNSFVCLSLLNIE